MFQHEVKRALRAAHKDGRISARQFKQAIRVFTLKGDAASRFWEAAENRVAICYRRSGCSPAGVTRINWAKLRAWLKENVLQILGILLALLPLFL